MGADGQIYAMAQGNLAVGGLGAEGKDGSTIVVNVPSTGRIPEGATVERAVETGFASTPNLTFNLARADFTTAQNVASAINARYGAGAARAVDGVSVAVQAPQGADVRATLMSSIENLQVTAAEAPAKVIVNARTGTVVINSAVRVSPAAVTHGKLTVRIDENQRISQPAPLSQGRTAVEQQSSVGVEEEKKPMFLLEPGPKLADVVKAVNAIGASPGRSGRHPRGAEGSGRAQGRVDRAVTAPIVSNPVASVGGVSVDTSRLATSDNLDKAGQQFEAIFINMMLKSMRSAKLGEGLFDNQASQQFRDMQDGKLAESMAAHTPIGIGRAMTDFLRKSGAAPGDGGTP